jgi:hypothetical protein
MGAGCRVQMYELLIGVPQSHNTLATFARSVHSLSQLDTLHNEELRAGTNLIAKTVATRSTQESNLV